MVRCRGGQRRASWQGYGLLSGARWAIAHDDVAAGTPRLGSENRRDGTEEPGGIGAVGIDDELAMADFVSVELANCGSVDRLFEAELKILRLNDLATGAEGTVRQLQMNDDS